MWYDQHWDEMSTFLQAIGTAKKYIATELRVSGGAQMMK